MLLLIYKYQLIIKKGNHTLIQNSKLFILLHFCFLQRAIYIDFLIQINSFEIFRSLYRFLFFIYIKNTGCPDCFKF